MIPEDSTKEELLLYIDDLQDLVFRLEQENRDLKDEINDMMQEIRTGYSRSDFEGRGL